MGESMAEFDWRWADDLRRTLMLALTDPDDPDVRPERTTDEIDAVVRRGKASTAAQLREMSGVRRVRPGVWRAEPSLARAAAAGRLATRERQADDR